jgi:glycosyltransferase involved in cell wall biosynthesis
MSGPRPLVTVITPCYNHAPYLDDYFQGLLQQTYREIELILIDDGSTDGSWEKIRSYEDRLRKAFPRVCCERQENAGAFRLIARACTRVTGDLVSILESDDYWLPGKLEENVRFLTDHPAAGAVHSDVDFVYPDRVESRHWASSGRTIPQGRIFEALLVENFIMTCAACYRADLIRRHVDVDRHREAGYLMGDYPLFLDLARHAEWGYIDKVLARYRVREGSASRPKDPQKAYRFNQSYHRIQQDYLARYGAPPDVAERVHKEDYRGRYHFGYVLRLRGPCEEGYRWLSERYPEEYRNPMDWLRAFSVRNRFLWWIVRRLDRMVYGRPKRMPRPPVEGG